ncbi:MAG: hypothetical protein HKN47_25610 [Pirellulaceae bacterium]|nr:hypothetical protein [Pirellulaceae bacterium]
MTPDDSYEVPFQTEDDITKDQTTAQSTGDDDAQAAADDPKALEIAQPFVGQWNELISTTNWEKGRIISEWRTALIDAEAESNQYSDEAWARRVGGVTAPHVGRLRRVYDRYGSTYETYNGLYWTHFLAALDWDDAPLWLEGASQEGWSIASMREKRWQENGAVESQRPSDSQIVEVDTDEDVVMPTQGGGRTKQYGDQPDAAAGKTYENADFGDEEELSSMTGGTGLSTTDDADAPTVQPFAGLPELPDDLSDAIETLKLTVLRHKTTGWQDTNPQTIQKYLDAVAVLMTAS